MPFREIPDSELSKEERQGFQEIPSIQMTRGGLIGAPQAAPVDVRAMGALSTPAMENPSMPGILGSRGIRPDVKGALMLTGPEHHADILAKQTGASMGKDIFGNVIAALPPSERIPQGERVMMETPADQAARAAASVGLESLAAAPALKAKRALTRLNATGALLATSSILQDYLARGYGSEQPIGVGKAAVTGALGMLGEGLVGAVDWAVRTVIPFSEMYRKGKGLTKKGIRTVRSLYGQEMVRVLNNRQLREQLDQIAKRSGGIREQGVPAAVEQATRAVRGVEATPGQAMGPGSTQAVLEKRIQTGAYGPELAQEVTRRQERAAETLEDTGVANVLQDIGGDVRISRGDAGSLIKGSLVARARQVQDQSRSLLQEADRLGARVDPNSVAQFAEQLPATRGFRDFPSPEADARLTALQDLSQQGDLSLQQFQAWDSVTRRTRRLMGKDKRQNQASLTNLLREVDAAIDDGRIVINGPPEAIDLYRRGKQLTADFHRRFSEQYIGNRRTKNLVQRLVSGSLDAGKDDLIDITDAGGAIVQFVKSGLGGKANITRDLQPLYRELGSSPNSRKWKAFKEEVFLELLELGRMPTAEGRQLSGRNLRNKWEQYLANDDLNSFITNVFTPRERERIGQFVDDAFRVTETMRLTNTAPTSEMIKDYNRRVRGIPFLSQSRFEMLKNLPGVQATIQAGGTRAASRAMEGQIGPKRILPRNIGAVAGALTADELFDAELAYDELVNVE